MTSHIIAILKQIAIFAENDNHPAFSECVNGRTAREQTYLRVKHYCFEGTRLNQLGARGYGLISFRTQRFPKIFGLSIPKFPKQSRKNGTRTHFRRFSTQELDIVADFRRTFAFINGLFSLCFFMLWCYPVEAYIRCSRWQEFKLFVLTR